MNKWLGGLLILSILVNGLLLLAGGNLGGAGQGDKSDRCPITAVKAFKCAKCNTCWTDEEISKAKKMEACVRKGYVCEECNIKSFKPGKCKKCKKDLKAISEKAEIITTWSCQNPSCTNRFQPTDQEGKCPVCGKPLEKTRICSMSGTFPHVDPATWPDENK
jgi:hypothetical protein